MKTTQACQTCGAVFTRFWAKSKPAPKHCSRSCSNKAPGRMTEEIKARIGLPREKNPNYRGGWKDPHGYVYIGKVKRSHIVWDAAHPEDPIQPHEHIHHKNKVRDDDRPENLEKLSDSDHIHLHRENEDFTLRKRNEKGQFV